MNGLSPEAQKTVVNKERFDAILQRMMQSKPLPLKDVVGTSPRQKPKPKKKSRN
jgi:hypothetical protein